MTPILLLVVLAAIAVVVVAALVAGVVIVAVVLGRAARRAGKRGGDGQRAAMPVTSIALAEEGAEVKVVGRVAPLEPPAATPLTGRLALVHSATLDRLDGFTQRRSYGQPARWSRQIDEARWRDVLLVDGSGEAQVVLREGAAELAVPAVERDFGGVAPPDEDARAFLARHGYVLSAVPEVHRLAERALLPGDRVAVVGRARWSDAPAAHPSGPGGTARRLVLEAGSAPVWVGPAD